MPFCIECGAGKENDGICDACGFEEPLESEFQAAQVTEDAPHSTPPPPPPLPALAPPPPAVLAFDESDEEEAEEPGLNIKFSSMTSDFATLFAQATSGIKQILAIKELLQHTVKAEQEHAKKMEKALAEEHKALAKMMENDGIVLHAPHWNGIVAALQARIAVSKQATDRITLEVIDPLNTVEKIATATLKNISNTMKDHEQAWKKCVDAMNKSKDVCRKTLELMHECSEKEKTESNPKKKAELVSKQASARTLAAEQSKVATQKIADANAATVVYQAGLRNCLDLLEDLDFQRLNHFTTRLEKWILCIRDAHVQQIAHSKTAYELLRDVNADTSLQTFIFNWVGDYGEPITHEPITYDLPLTSEEIKSGNVMIKGFQMFHLPLLQLLEKEKNAPLTGLQVSAASMNSLIQHQERTGKPLDVPLIMYVLCDAVQEMGGLQTQGIFRISIDSNLLLELQRQFDSGNFSLTLMKGDPHAAACLMKLWLRSLTDPLISKDHYKRATEGLQQVRNASSQQRRETGVRKEELDRAESAKFVLEVMTKLAPHNQALIRRIGALCKDVVANSAQNLMSYDALAVVFGPCFFRGPKVDDPMEMMQQSQREKAFVIELLMALGQK